MQNWKFIVDLLVVCVLTVSFGDEIDMKLVLLTLCMLDLQCRREAVHSKASRRNPKVRPLRHVYEIDYVVVLIFVHY